MRKDLTAREILAKLVSFPTVSRESNLALVDWVEDYLAAHGVRATRVYNDEGTKAALYANVGPEVEGGVVLSGHTDVVPVEGQAWDTDPYDVVEKDGRLYGRGTCDMKGFDAIALAAVPKALRAGLKRPLQIALSYDEEVGCLGAPRMIAEMAAHLPKAAAAIIGEPSQMKVVNGHKGGIGIATHLRGHEVHSSLMHTGVSAVMEGAKLIDWANRMNAENMARAPGPIDALFEPPWTTCHVGTITGGTADNITAKDCHFVMAFRCIPSETVESWQARYLAAVAEVEAAMRAVHPEARIDTDVRFQVPGLQPERDSAAEALARRITGDNATHAVSYATEAGQFQQAGYSAVIIGPGNIAQAHQPNEWLSLAEFEAGIAFVDRIIEHLCEDA
ncbi:acetylornithine deacetylase [Maritimibacter sp. HL-12]|uniref:acetylornithine deacetylase n=1 Tax=Maritimibacter sp. HL-12 TaxID=1162418 RepID=UPI000A0F34F2|nr:acetylornithine deacetylase [Maritimibacter sp. HL-12]SMH53017.1 acetylornithine deacetylase [Maritimibacter sp. HL-12]